MLSTVGSREEGREGEVRKEVGKDEGRVVN